MDQIVKERLVGMAVLLLLGVIFIPLVLDGETSDLQDPEQQNLQLPVPTQGEISHEMSFSDGNVKRIDLPVPTTQKSDSESQAEGQPQEKQESDNKATGAKLASQGLIADLPKIDKPQVKPAKPEPETQVATKPNPQAKPSGSINRSDAQKSQSTNKKDPSSAWVVQIGSFGQQANAEKEVQKLKAKGFPAFLRRYVTDKNKVLYRVRVGPEKERARAEKLAERLLKSDIKGQIVSDP